MSVRLRHTCLVLSLLSAAPLVRAQTNISRLINELHSPDPAVRDSAVLQLAKTHSPRPVQPLIEVLNDTNLRVANDTARALGEMHATEAVQPLIDSLTHSYCTGIVYGNPEAPAALAAIGMSAVPAIMQALTHTSYGVSGDNQLGKALDAIHSPGIVPYIIPLLQSPNYSVRIYAEERLAPHPGRATVDALLPMLNDPNTYVRGWAVSTLGTNMDDPRVLPAVRNVVEHPLNGDAKERNVPQLFALRVLNKQHDPGLIPVLIDGLQFSDIGMDEASTALIALGPVTIDPLTAALADTSRPAEARYWAAVTLGHFGGPVVLNALIAASHDAKRRVREGAFVSATASTDPGFIDRLLTALAEDNYWRVRQLAGYSLAGHKDPRINPALIAALKDHDENVRAAAADSLAKRHATEAIPQLIAYMQGPAVLDHQQGAQALGSMRDPRALEAVEQMYYNSSGGDRIVAKEALAQIEKDLYGNSSESQNGAKDSASVESAIATLRSTDAHNRDHAAEVLSDMGQQGVHLDPRAIGPLLNALDDPDQEVRRRAAIALINVDDPRKIEPFSRLLRSTDFALREYAAAGLGHVHDPRAVAALIAALSDPDFNTHRGLMNALQHNTYAPVLPALLAALRSPNPVVRAGAAEALRYRSEPGIAAALIPLQKDPDPAVQKAAAEALSGCPVPPVYD
jgi:HEAT repeat protein